MNPYQGPALLLGQYFACFYGGLKGTRLPLQLVVLKELGSFCKNIICPTGRRDIYK